MALTAPLETKIDALQSLIKTRLELFGDTWNVEKYIRKALLTATDQQSINAIMGSPIRYARLSWGTAANSGELLGGGNAQVAQRIDCLIWYGYEDEGSASEASEVLFRKLLEADPVEPSADPKGLLVYLRETKLLEVDNFVVYLTGPDAVTPELVEVRGDQRQWAHHIAFSITLT